MGTTRYEIIGVGNGMDTESGDPLICTAKEVTALYRKHWEKDDWSRENFVAFLKNHEIQFELATQ